MALTRFDLEQSIMACWNTSEDLKLLLSKVLEGDPTQDDVANALIGIERLHDMRCERVFDIFEELIRLGDLH